MAAILALPAPALVVLLVLQHGQILTFQASLAIALVATLAAILFAIGTGMRIWSSLAQLKLAQAQLVEAEKLSALGSLVAGLSHEISTPLGLATTTSSVLKSQTALFLDEVRWGTLLRSTIDGHVAMLQESVEVIERNLDRAAQLVRHYKQIAADRSSYQRRRYALREVIDGTMMILGPILRRKPVDLSVVVPADIVLDGYPGPLGQVITNLVTNALIHGLDEAQDPQITLSATRNDDEVRLVCTDNGKGMTPDVLCRAFEPFFTTKLGQGGSGLGLPIVRNLVTEVLGGTIALESEPGRGTTVTITLPLQSPGDRLEADADVPTVRQQEEAL